ncbi:Serine protease inhibitor [Lachnospiraceae bacterium XBB1006]|nr:Serine protease inhibitor [Lachnospiraceae bacterium XBB1006]
MKRIVPFISLGLSIAMLLGCVDGGKRYVEPKAKEEAVVVKEEKAQAYVGRYVEQLRTMGKKGNYIYSPESMNCALSMFRYVTTKEENRKVIEKIVGDTDYLAYANNEKSFRLINRIWKNQNKEMKIADEIKDYIYEMDMSDSGAATKKKNAYVSEQTNQFITSTPSILSKDTIYDIMNVTYFKDQWKDGDLRKDTKLHVFTTGTGKKTKTKYLHYDSAKTYYENDTAKAVEVPYRDGFSLLLIRPKKTLDAVSFENLLEQSKVADQVQVKFPEFETKSKFDLTDYFKNLGITKESADTDLKILQVAKIKVDKKGTEAAAVSEIVCGVTSIPTQEPKIVKISMNKPFYYAILDKKNQDVAFVGQVTKIK